MKKKKKKKIKMNKRLPYKIQLKFWNIEYSLPKNAMRLGNEIIGLRAKKGLSIVDAIGELDAEMVDYELCMKYYPFFRKQMKIGKKRALQWWLSRFGTMAMYKKCDVAGVKLYLKKEFGYDLEPTAKDSKRPKFTVVLDNRVVDNNKKSVMN